MTLRPQRAPKLIDATLREGNQTPGVRFGIAESVEIALALEKVGVDAIECGHPSAGEFEQRRVRAVVEAVSTLPVLAHARATLSDVRAVAATGARWVGIFLRLRDPRLSEAAERLISSAIHEAKDLGLQVRFTVEDGPRTDPGRLHDAYSLAISCGADRICFADSVGVALPWEAEESIARLAASFPSVPIEAHLHDDRGLADANALVAVRAGAVWVSSTVNGIGERCGISDTIRLIANLAESGLRRAPDGAALQQVSRIVAAHARSPVDAQRPIVGRNAFTHTSRLHQLAVAADESAYSWTHPGSLGREMRMDRPRPHDTDSLFHRPQCISATELRYHRHGPGARYVMLDNRFVPDSRTYIVVRRIPHLEDYGSRHVDGHRHDVDSVYLFLGDGEAMEGLQAEVTIGNRQVRVASPATVFVPAGFKHEYQVVGGSGYFVNIVSAGLYDDSLLSAEPAAEALAFLHEFLESRVPGLIPGREMVLSNIFDSLALMDLFVSLEGAVGDAITIDEVAGCRVYGDLIDLLAGSWPR